VERFIVVESERQWLHALHEERLTFVTYWLGREARTSAPQSAR
jgi:hypothetical protein